VKRNWTAKKKTGMEGTGGFHRWGEVTAVIEHGKKKKRLWVWFITESR